MHKEQSLISNVSRGIGAAVPIFVGYFSIAVSFGVLSHQAGITITEATTMSAMVFAGASQFMALNILLSGAQPMAIIAATFVLNLRHFIMSASLSQKLPRNPAGALVTGFGVTDETFVVNSITGENGRLSYPFVLTVNFVSYLGWVSGTWVGAQFAGHIPAKIASSMEIGLYAMFIGLLVPAIKQNMRVGLIAVFGAALCYTFNALLSPGWAVVLATMGGATIGTIFFGGKQS